MMQIRQRYALKARLSMKILFDNLHSFTFQLDMLAKKRRRATNSSTARSCSDYSYEQEESCGDLQMSNSSQFHLSNLLLLTLAEKATRDKQLMPLWYGHNSFPIFLSNDHSNFAKQPLLCIRLGTFW